MKDELLETEKMKALQVPEFKSYEEEAAFWDNLDTADFIEDDGEWFRFDTPHKKAVHFATLPEIAEEPTQEDQAKRIN